MGDAAVSKDEQSNATNMEFPALNEANKHLEKFVNYRNDKWKYTNLQDYESRFQFPMKRYCLQE